VKTLLCLALIAMSSVLAVGQTYQVLYTFTNGYGGSPTGTLAMDSAGNIYGTTPYGGTQCSVTYNQGCGIVFELSPQSGGAYYTYNTLHTFCEDYYQCADGALPYAGLVIDAAGNLYGTTEQGGSEASGTAFELSPPSIQGGAWTETILHNFCTTYHCTDGYFPYGRLLLNKDGSLDGTTSAGGNNTNCRDGCGTIFQLTPPVPPSMHWKENVLYAFCSTPMHGHCPDGETPMIGLTADGSGDLYGTTIYGGAAHSTGSGVLYKLSPGSGGLTQIVVRNFPKIAPPMGELAADEQGNIYGIVPDNFSHGVIYRTNSQSGNVLTSNLSPTLGNYPIAGVLVNSSQRLAFGTMSYGPSSEKGTVFSLDANGQGTVLYQFCSQFDCADGYTPGASLIQDSAGNLYGTTLNGGDSSCPTDLQFIGCGVVFKITP
jgi:uncharacterized repeat protein (TIGR03803 family)